MEQILYIGIAETFLAGLFILVRRPNMLANKILAAWLFIICIEMVAVLINDNLVDLYSLKIISLSYGPLLFLYCLYLTSVAPKFKPVHLVHFVPVLLFLIVSLVLIKEPVMNGTEGFFESDRFLALRLFYAICLFVSVTAYSIATFVLIHRHQKTIEGILSYRSNRVTLYWLIILSVTFYVTYIITFIFGGIDIFMGFMHFDPYEISFAGLTIFAFLFGLFGYDQKMIYGVNLKTGYYKGNEAMSKYARSGLKPDKINTYLKMIEVYMREQKPFTNGEMTIFDMSASLNIPKHYITEIINGHLGKNFYTLVNGYRVEEVKRMMADPKKDNFSILAIAYDSGFNSKSTFNTIFKNATGKTPSQYRKETIKERNKRGNCE